MLAIPNLPFDDAGRAVLKSQRVLAFRLLLVVAMAALLGYVVNSFQFQSFAASAQSAFLFTEVSSFAVNTLLALASAELLFREHLLPGLLIAMTVLIVHTRYRNIAFLAGSVASPAKSSKARFWLELNTETRIREFSRRADIATFFALAISWGAWVVGLAIRLFFGETPADTTNGVMVFREMLELWLLTGIVLVPSIPLLWKYTFPREAMRDEALWPKQARPAILRNHYFPRTPKECETYLARAVRSHIHVQPGAD